MVEQTELTTSQCYIKYTEADGDHAALYPATRLDWDFDRGFLRVYDGEILKGVYDLGIVKFAHVRENSKKVTDRD